MRIVLIISFLFLVKNFFGQINAVQSSTPSGDTVNNSATEYLVFNVKDAGISTSFQASLNRLSGTAGGTLTMQCSLDGTYYVDCMLDTISPGINGVHTVANVESQTFLWQITPNIYRYYRLKYAGSGTMSVRIRGYSFNRKNF